MQKRLLILFAGLLFSGWHILQAQDDVILKNGERVIADRNEYLRQVAADSMQELLLLRDVVPGLIEDIRYATMDNFTGAVVYDTALAFARRPVAFALRDAATEFRHYGLAIKLFDTYRPYAATLKFYDIIGDTNFVAAPWHGSRHNRGCAVDLTLVDLSSGEDLDMGTPFDDFTEMAGHAWQSPDPKVRENRALLRGVMMRHGFDIYPYEWWHYDFRGWENYPPMDIPLREVQEAAP